jgi:hypothetical protein
MGAAGARGGDYLDVAPLLVPVPGLDGHVIAAGEDDRGGGVDGEASDVVWMGLEGDNLFVGVVVEDAELVVVGAGDEPVFAGDEADAADGDVGDLEGLDDGAGVEVVDVDGAVVEAGEQPGLGRVEVDALDAVRTGKELALGGVSGDFCYLCFSTHSDVEKHWRGAIGAPDVGSVVTCAGWYVTA